MTARCMLGRNRQLTFQGLIGPLPKAVKNVHQRSSRSPLKKGWRTLPSGDFAVLDLGQRLWLGPDSLVRDQGCVLRINFCRSVADALSNLWSTFPA
jgi:hypothetical protein